MENDDRPIGRILDRREVLALLGTMGAAAMLNACVQPGTAPASTRAGTPAASTTNAAPAPGCVVRPALTEGPLFVEEALDRSDIRPDPSTSIVSQGAPLALTFLVTQVGKQRCAPLPNVKIDIWHCDAQGIYSDTSQLGMNTVGQKFLRGYQHTDANGMANFTTIYPGWYVGRAVHIHFKIRNEQGYEFTSQLFFDDALTEEVFQAEPYASRGKPKLRNADDGIFQQSGGQLTLTVDKAPTGYVATFAIGLQLDA